LDRSPRLLEALMQGLAAGKEAIAIAGAAFITGRVTLGAIGRAMHVLETWSRLLDEPAHIGHRHGAEPPGPFQPPSSDGVVAGPVERDFAMFAGGEPLAGLRLSVVVPAEQLLHALHIAGGDEKE